MGACYPVSLTPSALCRFRRRPEEPYNASAPDTTSMISRVIAACRTLFM